MSIIQWFVNTKAWAWLATHVIALITFRVLGYPKFQMAKFFDLAAAIKADIGPAIYCVMGADTQAASFKMEQLMGKAYYSHVGFLVVGDVNDYATYRMLHITSKGMALDHVLDYLREVDRVAVVKMPISDAIVPFVQKVILDYISMMASYSYDFGFDLGTNKKLYCAELVYQILRLYTDKIITKFKGKTKIVTPDNIFESGTVVYLV